MDHLYVLESFLSKLYLSTQFFLSDPAIWYVVIVIRHRLLTSDFCLNNFLSIDRPELGNYMWATQANQRDTSNPSERKR